MKPLSNFELISLAKRLKIPHFRGVFSSDDLPRKPWKRERSIVNLQSSGAGEGSHWVAYKKDGNTVIYNDSFGNLKPDKKLLEYFKNCEVYYNYRGKQKFGSVICGHLSLEFLNEL